jgi:hypothetical protein
MRIEDSHASVAALFFRSLKIPGPSWSRAAGVSVPL